MRTGGTSRSSTCPATDRLQQFPPNSSASFSPPSLPTAGAVGRAIAGLPYGGLVYVVDFQLLKGGGVVRGASHRTHGLDHPSFPASVDERSRRCKGDRAGRLNRHVIARRLPRRLLNPLEDVRVGFTLPFREL